MAHIITLTGATGAGKSIILRDIVSRQRPGFEPLVIRKYTTRARRDGEDELETKPVLKMPPDCDLVYEQYGVRYGLSLKNLHNSISSGRTPVLVVNDIRVLEEIREVFGPLMRAVYVFRESPSIERIRALSQTRGSASEDEIVRRHRKAQAIFRIFIENIDAFDYVIMNVRALEDLHTQVESIVNRLVTTSRQPLRSSL
jgi:guanylate kinase